LFRFGVNCLSIGVYIAEILQLLQMMQCKAIVAKFVKRRNYFSYPNCFNE